MRLIDDLDRAEIGRPTVVTIGSYDGLHVGHRRLLSELIAHAHDTDRLSALVTFHPHPRAVLSPWLSPKVLTTPGEKAVLLAQWGLDILVLLRFSPELAQTPAPDFVRHLCQRLHMAELWVGENFALGRGREGDVAALRRMGALWGFTVRVIETVTVDGQSVSSTRVRELLATGQVAEARKLLGRPYSIAGEVVSGARRGRCLGYPTANLAVRPERAMPPDGVYAVRALVGEQRYPAVANIGERPSFNGEGHTVEVHILDYEGDLYGQDLVVEFMERLRPERRYEDICELIRQIGSDSENARQLLGAQKEEAREQQSSGIS